MAFGIYKPEQGYWVRVLTAVGAGVLVLAGAAWAWAQTGAVTPPASGYVLELAGVSEPLQPGDAVELVGLSSEIEATEVVLGNAGVIEYTQTGPGTARLSIAPPEAADGFLINRVEQVRSSDGTAARVEVRRQIDLFPLIYLQAGVTAAVILLGSIAVFWFVASNQRSVDFLINTDGEMRKVNWSTRKEVVGSTQVVIVAAFLIAAFLFIVDLCFQLLFQTVGVLES